MKATDPITQETSRGFYVLVDAPATKYRRKPRVLRYPASGCSPYTGRQALAVLELFAKTRPLLSCRAWTTGHGVEETLTLAEMREVIL